MQHGAVMSTLIEAIGPLAFWTIALGIAPAALLVSLMALVSAAWGRLTEPKDTKHFTRAS